MKMNSLPVLRWRKSLSFRIALCRSDRAAKRSLTSARTESKDPSKSVRGLFHLVTNFNKFIRSSLRRQALTIPFRYVTLKERTKGSVWQFRLRLRC